LRLFSILYFRKERWSLNEPIFPVSLFRCSCDHLCHVTPPCRLYRRNTPFFFPQRGSIGTSSFRKPRIYNNTVEQEGSGPTRCPISHIPKYRSISSSPSESRCFGISIRPHRLPFVFDSTFVISVPITIKAN
jgi:hypothetical protein